MSEIRVCLSEVDQLCGGCKEVERKGGSGSGSRDKLSLI